MISPAGQRKMTLWVAQEDDSLAGQRKMISRAGQRRKMTSLAGQRLCGVMQSLLSQWLGHTSATREASGFKF